MRELEEFVPASFVQGIDEDLHRLPEGLTEHFSN